MKKLAIGFAVLVIIIAGGLCYLHSNLDSIVRAAIEKYGTQAAQTDVRVGGVKLSITTGEGALSELSVANPKGFSSAKALSMGTISVKLDTSSVTGSGPIVISEIVIEKPLVNFEVNTTGGNNLQTIERNATANSAVSSASSSSGNSAAQQPSRKVIISELTIRDGQIGISSPLLQGKSLSAPLPVIHLTNIGKDSGGATPSQVADLVLKSITASASKVASSDLIKNLGSNVTSGASGIANGVSGLLR